MLTLNRASDDTGPMQTPMTFESALAYTLAMAVYSLSPGPALAATLGLAARSGVAPAMWLLTGMVVGDALYLVAAVGGLAALADSFESAFRFIQIASGAFLVFLGWQTWLDARRPLAPPSPSPNSALFTRPSSPRRLKHFVLGLGITLGNPKTILFYLALLPSFLDLARMTILDTTIAVLIMIAVSYATFGPAAYLAQRASRRAVASRFSLLLRRLAAVALAASGVYIAADGFAA